MIIILANPLVLLWLSALVQYLYSLLVPSVLGLMQCVPIKRKPVLSVRYLHCHARFNQTICFIIKGIFSSFIWYQTHDDISMHDWKGIIWTHACQSRFAQNNDVELIWTKFRLAYPCQNKESKQKKHDKSYKRNVNECLFQHVPLFSNVADPVKPLNSYSAQINFDITIWKWFVLGHAWLLHLVSGVKRKRIKWIL